MGIMTGKTCVVTGGAGSIGLASASLLRQEGARVMLVDRDVKSLREAAASLTAGATAGQAGAAERVATVAANVADAEDTKRYLGETVRRWGKIDVIFCNAGVAGAIAPVTEYPEEVFDEVMAVNVRGSFLACKYGLPLMNDGGSIVITSSIMGVTGGPLAVAYATSKHALVGLARVVATEAAARRIRVNVLAPGPTDNTFQRAIEKEFAKIAGQDSPDLMDKMIPLGRHAEAEEIAQMVLFLASDRSSFSTGAVFMADGGMAI